MVNLVVFGHVLNHSTTVTIKLIPGNVISVSVIISGFPSVCVDNHGSFVTASTYDRMVAMGSISLRPCFYTSSEATEVGLSHMEGSKNFLTFSAYHCLFFCVA